MSKNEVDDSEKNSIARDSEATPAGSAVGYGRPPVATQFKKGISGNPRGRPKKRERAWSAGQLHADILREANREVEVTTNGITERLSMYEFIIRRILTDAARGDFRSKKLAIETIGDAAAGRARLNQNFYNLLEAAERNTLMGGPLPRNSA